VIVLSSTRTRAVRMLSCPRFVCLIWLHTVAKGDTLWGIAVKYLGNGTRYKEIKALNGLTSDVIYSSQKLKIPN